MAVSTTSNTWVVGPTGRFKSLRSALMSREVRSGATLLLQASTFREVDLPHNGRTDVTLRRHPEAKERPIIDGENKSPVAINAKDGWVIEDVVIRNFKGGDPRGAAIQGDTPNGSHVTVRNVLIIDVNRGIQRIRGRSADDRALVDRTLVAGAVDAGVLLGNRTTAQKVVVVGPSRVAGIQAGDASKVAESTVIGVAGNGVGIVLSNSPTSEATGCVVTAAAGTPGAVGILAPALSVHTGNRVAGPFAKVPIGTWAGASTKHATDEVSASMPRMPDAAAIVSDALRTLSWEPGPERKSPAMRPVPGAPKPSPSPMPRHIAPTAPAVPHPKLSPAGRPITGKLPGGPFGTWAFTDLASTWLYTLDGWKHAAPRSVPKAPIPEAAGSMRAGRLAQESGLWTWTTPKGSWTFADGRWMAGDELSQVLRGTSDAGAKLSRWTLRLRPSVFDQPLLRFMRTWERLGTILDLNQRALQAVPGYQVELPDDVAFRPWSPPDFARPEWPCAADCATYPAMERVAQLAATAARQASALDQSWKLGFAAGWYEVLAQLHSALAGAMGSQDSTPLGWVLRELAWLVIEVVYRQSVARVESKLAAPLRDVASPEWAGYFEALATHVPLERLSFVPDITAMKVAHPQGATLASPPPTHIALAG